MTSAPHHKALAVVFVHGLFGKDDQTWETADHSSPSFPKLLADDPQFNRDTDVFVHSFYTPYFNKAGSIVAVAEELYGKLKAERVFTDHARVVIVSHSMGGLVVRKLLLTHRELLTHVPMLYFYATPTNGSELPVVAQHFSKNAQLRDMLPLEDNPLLEEMVNDWLGLEDARRVASFCAYESQQILGVKVVSPGSAIALCNRPPVAINANHLEVVKPKNGYHDKIYYEFANALRDTVPQFGLSAPHLKSAVVSFTTGDHSRRGSTKVSIALMGSDVHKDVFARTETDKDVEGRKDNGDKEDSALTVNAAKPFARDDIALSKLEISVKPRAERKLRPDRKKPDKPDLEKWSFDLRVQLTFNDEGIVNLACAPQRYDEAIDGRRPLSILLSGCQRF